ncbi:MAG: glycosyltransferase family 2 protein [Candidatus Peribacteraceae bacterium]|jgi:glycosyltransferase involved in cell wall biosynthesis|nr:glycosyltransferase family 2 protein [Candidatus Peribacteraceae bacterium]MDP7454742.1 glycosyltransferase family 2 protein [Candidatus Peribacteraceae bacterium]|tara:strand:- start:1264 stop:1947 length:684 start_codon:yes stop_codon:yes gene_type:complete
MFISIILPCLNEEENIELVVNDVFKWFKHQNLDGEVIAVNDGSEDQTGPLLDRMAVSNSRLKVIHHNENKGHGKALISGFSQAKGEIWGMMDSDGQIHAEDFTGLLPFVRSKQIAIGRRVKRVDPFPRKVFMRIYALLVWIILGVRVKDVNCGMKLFHSSDWPKLEPRIATGGFFHAELLCRAKRSGILLQIVPVSHYPRHGGKQTGASIKVIKNIVIELLRLRRGL